MSLVSWDKTMSVGVEVLDEDHRKLFAMVNELYEGIIDGNATEVLAAVLDRLVAYTEEHFAREEAFFAQTDYPGAAEQKKEHSELVAQVSKVQINYKGHDPNKDGGASLLSLEVVNYLKTWLVYHIQGTDKKYGPYLNEKGIS